jgi:lipopolysaccharide transport system permease protein
MFFLAWRDVTVRYKQTAIGVAWVLIRPLMTMLVFVAFRRMVGLRGDEVPDSILVMAAVLPWQLFSTALSESSTSLISNSNLITKVYFPRLIIPVASAATSLVDFVVTLSLLALLMAWSGFFPGWQILYLPVFVLLALGVSVGAGLFLAALNVKYRDFRYVMPFIVQFGLFVSPVAFKTQDIPEKWQLLYSLNPMAGIIDGFRWSILAGRTPLDTTSLTISVTMTIFLLWLGVWYFRKMERGFADVI